jgi:hypothetical protein
MSNPAPLKDEKHDISPPAGDDNVTKTDVLVNDHSVNPYFRAFDANDAEWHKAFEKKLMRKVDLRLIPLMIIMWVHCPYDGTYLTSLINVQVP